MLKDYNLDDEYECKWVDRNVNHHKTLKKLTNARDLSGGSAAAAADERLAADPASSGWLRCFWKVSRNSLSS